MNKGYTKKPAVLHDTGYVVLQHSVLAPTYSRKP